MITAKKTSVREKNRGFLKTPRFTKRRKAPSSFVKKENDDLENFSHLSEKSFSFWEDSSDDIYKTCNAI